ncbi:hypothetical protein EYR41_002783 [Orbilia oligospora]|uniref:tyrosine--tRNA ligase n=1 Tax=Orbilia oligospora TaxID=2813651 RepID=A0A7C8KEY8_ORBOL|nr:hypothetical protein TWF751_008798 [Orbilia oligospora]TGJ70763.1 hypothetical protein EYR41_002783 [Orbilia oligospora]
MEPKITPTLTVDERYRLIIRRQTLFQPFTSEDSLKRLLAKKLHPTVAWVTAPTGKPHVGYFVPLTKMVDFLRAGLQPIILYVDIYALLVNYVHPMPLVKHRLSYYRQLTTAVLRSLGVSPEQITHIDESSYAYTEAFIQEFHKLIVMMRRTDAHCTSEVAETEMLSPLLCCIHQTLGEVFTGMDIQFGGLDQYDLFAHSATFLPLINHKPREHIMNNMVPSLKYTSPESSPSSSTPSSPTSTSKMSSSHAPDAKIEFLDIPEIVHKKVSEADCNPGDITQGNGVLGILRDIIWPIAEMTFERSRGTVGYNLLEGKNIKTQEESFVFPSAPEGSILSLCDLSTGEERHYSTYHEIEMDYADGIISPNDLKNLVIGALNHLLRQIRNIYQESEEWQMVDELAYPGGVY